MKINFSRLREYGNGTQRTNISTSAETIQLADELSTKVHTRSLMIAFSIRVVIYLLSGKGLDRVIDMFNAITEGDEKSIRVVVGNLLRLSKRLGDL